MQSDVIVHIITRGRWRRGIPLIDQSVLVPRRPSWLNALTINRHPYPSWTINDPITWREQPIASRSDGVNIWPSDSLSMPFAAMRSVPITEAWPSRYLETAITRADRRWPLQRHQRYVGGV